jgi:hypothetical protein
VGTIRGNHQYLPSGNTRSGGRGRGGGNVREKSVYEEKNRLLV